VVFTLVLSILGGYAFARFQFWGRDTLFLLIVAILIVPYVTLLSATLANRRHFLSLCGKSWRMMVPLYGRSASSACGTRCSGWPS
jgi:ABC-type glycerol-3-phosphate transport system permease component